MFDVFFLILPFESVTPGSSLFVHRDEAEADFVCVYQGLFVQEEISPMVSGGFALHSKLCENGWLQIHK